jgi:hypothetical protein
MKVKEKWLKVFSCMALYIKIIFSIQKSFFYFDGNEVHLNHPPYMAVQPMGSNKNYC